MTSFGHENDFFSTIVGRAENVSSTSYIGGNNVFYMTWKTPQLSYKFRRLYHVESGRAKTFLARLFHVFVLAG